MMTHEDVRRRVAISRNGVRFERTRAGEWVDDPVAKPWADVVTNALRTIADSRDDKSTWTTTRNGRRVIVDPRGYKVRFEELNGEMWVIDSRFNKWGVATTKALAIASDTPVRPLPEPIYVKVES
jgi:hypothetical protein